MNNFDIRTIIKKILKESIKQLQIESQKSNGINQSIIDFFHNCKFNLNGEEILSQVALREIREECIIKSKALINQTQYNNFDYENFYAIKFGGFFIKNGDKHLPLTFEPLDSKENLFKTFFTSFVVYVYNDYIFKIVPYNENMDSDVHITKNITNYINSKEFQTDFSSKKQKAKLVGEIKILEFSRKNVIITNYFNNLQFKKQNQDKTSVIKYKKDYRPNTPFNHKLFGKGVIKSSKTVKKDSDGIVYNVQVEFPRYGLKTIQARSQSRY